jgi:prepilin-type N-terminal cleavage/methylation domain-containing protein
MNNFRNNKGFTLIEMAIVLVIIGIILGAVLKGGDLIDNAKEKKFKSEISTLVTSYYNYYDKYGRIPGDDNTAAARWAAAPAATSGNNNGLINTAGEIAAQTGALDHLRRAGFINDQPTNTATAFTSLVYNGVTINFDSALSVAQFGKGSNYLSIAGMSDDDMGAYDTKYDDGVSSTGDVQSAVPAAYATGTNMIIRVR